MATVTRNYVAFESGLYKQRPSNLDQVAFSGVAIGTDGLLISDVSSNFDFAGYALGNVANPTLGNQAATKAYVDMTVQGLDPKQAANAATTANLAGTYANGTSGVGATLTASANAALVVDGITLAVDDRLLVKDQTSGAQNGIYSVTIAGDAGTAWKLTRAEDFDAGINGGEYLFVVAGDTNADYGFVCSNTGAVVIGTTPITFVVFTSVATATATSAPGGGTQGSVTADEDKGLKISSGVLEVKRDQAGAIGVSTGSTGGLLVNLEASNPSLAISSDALGVKLDPAGALAKGSAGVAVQVGNGISISSDALVALAGDSTIQVTSAGIEAKFSENLPSDAAVTAGQIVYMKSNGHVDLAIATDSSYGPWTQFGVVADASISSGAAGLVYVRPGALIAGFSGLTAAAPVYLSQSTAGAYQQDLSGFSAGNSVVLIGYAYSTTKIQFAPAFLLQF